MLPTWFDFVLLGFAKATKLKGVFLKNGYKVTESVLHLKP